MVDIMPGKVYSMFVGLGNSLRGLIDADKITFLLLYTNFNSRLCQEEHYLTSLVYHDSSQLSTPQYEFIHIRTALMD